MRVPLRYRLGQRLLRRYIATLFWHYDREAKAAHERGDHQTAEHCEYIGIGLAYANGEPWNRNGLEER